MHVQGIFIILIWFTGFSYFLSTALGATPILAPDEVETLKQIAITLGKTNWNFNIDPCSKDSSWFTTGTKESSNNVTCDCTTSVCHITGIVLKSQSLPGVLPPELAKLPFIQVIDLSRNYLNGTIPREWGATKLVNISLLGNRLTGLIPTEISNISTLSDLVLDQNQFSGHLPPELGNLKVLQRLIITSNNFSGALPRELAKLLSLKEFRISDNQFTGKIPDFYRWTKLKRLDIQACGLEGPLPNISGLSDLADMRFSDLNGPDAGFPELKKLPNLKHLILRSCNIIGALPDYITNSNFPNLKLLDLSFNKLTGKLPPSFNELNKLTYLYLSSNFLTGELPDWMLNDVGNVDLSYNNFTTKDTSCHQSNKNLFGSSLWRNYSGTIPCLKSKSLRCKRKNYKMYINCGGDEVDINGILYGEDLGRNSASTFTESKYNWVSSNTGHFLDDNDENDKYIATNMSRLWMKDDQLYMTARLSPISLTYYGYCMGKGNYTVVLHFTEIQFTSDRLYSSLGRRIFDVYIQGNRVLQDFNIEANSVKGVSNEVKKKFTAIVNESLEIRLIWAGKGTQGIPNRGVYGPLISAISVYSDFNPPSESKISAGGIAGIVVSVITLIFITLAIILWRRWLKLKTIDQELRDLDLQTGSFTLRQIKAATNNFHPENKIGEGGFGSVFKGCLSNGTVIAVKQLSSKSQQGNKEFVNEIGMISALQHPYLVKLYGCCIEGNQLLLVYEYLENNSLARALFGREELQIKLDWWTRQKICIGIAKGLAYLHEESRLKIVHRDIKATNVLLDKDLSPKISDFGLAKLNEDDHTHISTRIAGTIGYMAPEYAMKGYLTDKADVYSFGIVALEIVSGRTNLNNKLREECVDLLNWAMVLQQKGDLMELVDPRLGSEYNKEEVMRMINIALACTNASSTLRPRMTSVVRMLEGLAMVEENVSNSNVPTVDSKLIARVDIHRGSCDKTIFDTHNKSISNDGPWTGSSASANDLYPIKLDSHYWTQRE